MSHLPLFDTMDEETHVSFNELEQQLLADLRYLRVIDFDSVAQESFSDGLVRLFAGTVNTLMHFVHTFKTGIFRSYRTLKRTELVYYHESNSVSVRRIFDLEFSSVKSLEIPIPNKMQGTYKEVSLRGITALRAFNMLARTSALKVQVKRLRDSVLGTGTAANIVPSDIQDLPVITASFKEFDAVMKGPSRRSVPFSEFIQNKEEFKEVDALLLDSAKYQYEVEKVATNLDTTSALMNEILTFLQKGMGTLTKEDLVSISQLMLFYAKIFDMYGLVVQDMARVEHNFVEVLKLVRKTYNL